MVGHHFVVPDLGLHQELKVFLFRGLFLLVVRIPLLLLRHLLAVLHLHVLLLLVALPAGNLSESLFLPPDQQPDPGLLPLGKVLLERAVRSVVDDEAHVPVLGNLGRGEGGLPVHRPPQPVQPAEEPVE